MGVKSTIAIWMVVKMLSTSDPATNPNGYTTVAFFNDKNDCMFVAASNENWKCIQRPDWEEELKSREKIKFD